jgi:type I restriction enzyme S subunit
VTGPRLKDLGRWFSGGTPPSERAEYWDGDVPWLSGKDFDKTVLREPTKFTTAEGAALHSRLMPGGRSVLVLVRGMALAHGVPVARLPFDAAVNQDVRGLRVGAQFDPDFVYYALVGHRAGELNAHIDQAAHGTARLQETVYAHRLAWMPDLTAQRVIARFLDRECDRIAAALNALERSRASVVGVRSELVGEMLDRVQPVVLKRVGVRVTQGWSPQAEDREPIGDEAAVLKLSAISGGYFDPRQMKALPHANASEVGRYRVRGGDLLMVRASGSLSQLGRACLVTDEPARPLLFPDIVYRLTCDEAQAPPWVLGEILATPQGRDAVEMLKRGAANNKVRIEDVRNLAVPIPTPELLGRIMRLMTWMVPAERSVARSSEHLSEALPAYRDSLIHEAVTGKLDVTAASERQMDERLHAAAENRLDEVPV